MPRSRLGPLAIESKLGDHPSTSSVWRAVHVQLKKSVAVKVFSAPFGGTPEARQTFANEWETLKKLSHPGVARCYGGGFEDADAYLAYELIEGETLSSQIERNGRLSWENTLEVAQGVAEALEYLHGQGVVHGAIVPDKIVVSGFAPVLVDLRLDRFGSPFRTSRPPSVDQFARQAPELIAPDVINPSEHNSAASDLYALGAMLYHAITGRLPVDGDTIEAVRQTASTFVPESPASIVLQCPVWFDKLIMQLLEKNPANRPPSATAVKLQLAEVRKRALSRAGVAEHVSSGFSPLQVTNQQARDEARQLLGRGVVDLSVAEEEDDEVPDATVWHDQPWFLIGGLVAILILLAYVAWPASEATLRAQAEKLIAIDTRASLAEAENQPLRQLIVRFPDGPNAKWAQQQVDRINVLQFLHQLKIKIKNNLPIKDQGELLHKQAQAFEENGDIAQALDKYRSMVTVLGDDADYETAVNAARYKIGVLGEQSEQASDARKIVQRRLEEADELLAEGQVVEARKIWYSLVELYGDNSELKPLIDIAQSKLAEKLQRD
ncbi:serine/threonine-protein kinase [Rhodopirellula sp. MGV]|uniref:serine/threonine-protein kinase n=1 Tax=Rhodopirellula sp. MGV TaxID=2023130 RepID=UPI000B965DF7|nr:serine/threonine-protein kinase [Rhodopirellula sp. MGV]OYP37750.1 protein kinase [Rhodopirellula sp. MGV]PNY37187.1 serine/threonine protein kinase [Rhodopirellula baltica]